MKFNLKSISSKLVFGGLAIMLIPLIIVGFLAATKAENALLDISLGQVDGIAEDLARLTRKLLESEMEKAASMAAQKRVREMAEAVTSDGLEASQERVEEVYGALKKQFETAGANYQGIFIADAQGKLYNGVLENGQPYRGSDISSRDYFQSAKRSGETVVSEMVISKTTGKTIVVICSPIRSDSSQFLGVVGLAVKVGYFTDLISGRKIGKTGYGWMINSQGLFLAHPVPENILKLDVTSIPEMKDITAKMKAGEKGHETSVISG